MHLQEASCFDDNDASGERWLCEKTQHMLSSCCLTRCVCACVGLPMEKTADGRVSLFIVERGGSPLCVFSSFKLRVRCIGGWLPQKARFGQQGLERSLGRTRPYHSHSLVFQDPRHIQSRKTSWNNSFGRSFGKSWDINLDTRENF